MSSVYIQFHMRKLRRMYERSNVSIFECILSYLRLSSYVQLYYFYLLFSILFSLFLSKRHAACEKDDWYDTFCHGIFRQVCENLMTTVKEITLTRYRVLHLTTRYLITMNLLWIFNFGTSMLTLEL